MYKRKDPKKIKMDEFVVDVNFKYGVPMLMLDIINALTGFDIISQLKDEFEPVKTIQRLNPENENFIVLKNKIPDEMQEHVFDFFSDLGERENIDISKLDIPKRSEAFIA